MKSFRFLALAAFSMAIPAFANSFRVTPYLQHVAPDAMSILWLAQEAGQGSLSWWEADTGKKLGSAKTTPRLAEELSYDPKQTNYPSHFLTFTLPYQHRYRITGLKPDTRYGYAVELGGGVRYTNVFRTAPSEWRPVRFTCFADSETEPESTGAKVVWEDPADDKSKRRYFIDQTTGFASNIVSVKAFKPDFMIYAGDLAEMGSKQVDWDEFWRHNAGPINDPAGSIPILAAPGNHEYHNYWSEFGETGMKKYLSYFEFEPNGTAVAADQQQRFHRLDYGPVTILFIDPNNGPNAPVEKDTNVYLDESTCRAPDFNPGSIQYKWMEEQLADAQKQSAFTFVVCHQCPYSIGYHGRKMNEKGTEQYGEELSGTATRILTDMFIRYGVDGWLCGHDELYEHSVVKGEEVLPDGKKVPHSIHVYDTGFAGDGLRGRQRTEKPNPHEVFRAHVDAPEVWKDGLLVSGGKHYGHMEIVVAPNKDGVWEATLTPAYVFVTQDKAGKPCGFERRVYDDVTVLKGKRTPLSLALR